MACARPPRSAQSAGTLAALLVPLALLAGACGGDDPPADGGDGPRVTLKVMTRNLYLGSELSTVIFTPAEQLSATAATFLQTVRASDPVARMALVAQEIAEAAPDLVALQEVERFRTQTPSNFDLEAPAPPDAGEDLFDFLALLQAGLMERGLMYDAIENVLSDAELPAAVEGGALMDVRMTDRDVILIRRGLTHSVRTSRVYADHLPFRIGGKVPVKLVRGFHAVDVTHEGVPLTFVGSHLEVGGQARGAQQGQAAELVKALGEIPGTLVAAGDFNSPADRSETTSYDQLSKILTDGWIRAGGGAPGLTCCSDLDASAFEARSRIDLVLHRGPVRAESASVVGTDPTRRTAGGLFPSDHAGVVMTLSIRKPD